MTVRIRRDPGDRGGRESRTGISAQQRPIQLELFASLEEKAAAILDFPSERSALAPAPLSPPPPLLPHSPIRRRLRRDPGLPRNASEAEHESIRLLRVEYERFRPIWGIGPAEISLSRRRLTGGLITYGIPHRIRISLHMSPDERRETLLHEVAHAICWTRDGDAREGHGPRFWQIARSLGVRRRNAPETDALRRHREEKAIHLYRCEGCGGEWRRFRPFRRAMLCASCNGREQPARLRKVRNPPPWQGGD